MTSSSAETWYKNTTTLYPRDIPDTLPPRSLSNGITGGQGWPHLSKIMLMAVLSASNTRSTVTLSAHHSSQSLQKSSDCSPRSLWISSPTCPPPMAMILVWSWSTKDLQRGQFSCLVTKPLMPLEPLPYSLIHNTDNMDYLTKPSPIEDHNLLPMYSEN